MWFIQKVLPISWLEDSKIIPYFTPCNGHGHDLKRDKCVTSDEIDGVLPMQAYCIHCRKENT